MADAVSECGRSNSIDKFDTWIDRVIALRQNSWAGLAIGLVLLALALAVRMGLQTQLAPFPFLTFFPAIILTALLGGARPAAVVAVLSAAAAWFFFMGPAANWRFTGSNVVGLGFYAFVAVIDIALIEMLHRVVARQREQRVELSRIAAMRESMFKELQHRVANNMQFVAAMLSMQQRQVDGTPAAAALEQATTRLRAMSRAHRLLYDPANADRQLGPLIEELCHDLLEATGAKNIVVRVETPELRMPIDRVLTLSMVITEAITNALKHAFTGGRPGTIRVTLEKQPDDHLLLSVSDDGAGMPAGASVESPQSLGMRIVRSLAQQLKGELALVPLNPGTALQLRFPAS